jgi:hypothetical protein
LLVRLRLLLRLLLHLLLRLLLRLLLLLLLLEFLEWVRVEGVSTGVVGLVRISGGR